VLAEVQRREKHGNDYTDAQMRDVAIEVIDRKELAVAPT